MRKCYLDNLPKKYGFGANKDRLSISWSESMGYVVPFEYDGVCGELKILSYNPKKQKVLIKYNSIEREIATSQLINCTLGGLLGKHNKNYIYAYGETISKDGIGLVIRRFRKGKDNARHYTLKCLDCKDKYDRSEGHLKDRGAKCPYCSDGVSYPNKFMYSVFEQLNVSIKREETFEWLDKCKYDIYIPSHNIIIENHGLQHYTGGFQAFGGRSLEEEIENDIMKKEFAINNGYIFIALDCRESNVDYIRESVLKSELNNIFNLDLVDWNKCHEYACSNMMKLVCSLFVEGDSFITQKIANELDISRTTVYRYLKVGAELGWCNYDAAKIQSLNRTTKNKLKAKPIVCIETGQKFESATKCAEVSMEVFGVKMLQSKISRVCNGESKFHHGYSFKYINDSDNISINNILNNDIIKLICSEKNVNKDITTKQLAEKYGLNNSTIRDYLIKGTKLGLCNYDAKEERRKGSSISGIGNGINVDVFKDGKHLGRYPSATQLTRISEEIFGIKFLQSSISDVCTGKRKSHKGFTFKYANNKSGKEVIDCQVV